MIINKKRKHEENFEKSGAYMPDTEFKGISMYEEPPTNTISL